VTELAFLAFGDENSFKGSFDKGVIAKLLSRLKELGIILPFGGFFLKQR
jgi:hypothetical protein